MTLNAKRKITLKPRSWMAGLCVLALLTGCADVDVPGTRNVNVPTPVAADERQEAVNDVADSVLYLPLGRDVLVPLGGTTDSMPKEEVGPFELRGETLAGALQLILAEYDISLAFENDLGMTRTVTVANLRGPLNRVVETVCGLADLYCAYENDMVVIKETQTFTVKIPPISSDQSFMQNVSTGLQAIIGGTSTIDPSTRTIVYKATHRTAELAERYFQRMRSSTALIVFETYIWEVTLSSSNATGIRWDLFGEIGKFGTGITLNGQSAVSALGGNAVSIGIPTTQSFAAGIPATRLFQFLSRFGTVKTVSQPQITVLSGSQAKFRAATEDTFVSSFSETIDNGQSTVAVQTSTIDTGLTLTIGSAWDNATVYANVAITLADADVGDQIPFGNAGDNNFIQLPESTERELETQVRVRPGDSILIAGLVQEEDRFNKEGIGITQPWLPSGRSATTANSELVFLLRPRVVVYTSPSEEEYYKTVRGTSAESEDSAALDYDFAPLKGKPVVPARAHATAAAAMTPSVQPTLTPPPVQPIAQRPAITPFTPSSNGVPVSNYQRPAQTQAIAPVSRPVPLTAPREEQGNNEEQGPATSVPVHLLDPSGGM